jgi:DNA-binding NtrC family response regulator
MRTSWEGDRKMQKEFKKLSLHQKMVVLVTELVEKELPIKEALREFEKIYIETAEKKYNGNKTKIARALGIHRNTLHNLYKALKIK